MPKPPTTHENHDQWQNWAPVWTIAQKNTAAQKTPHDIQEKKLPTIKQEKSITRRRKTDARLWDSLGPHHQEAAIQIERACQILMSGIGMRTSRPDLQKISGSFKNDISDYQAQLTSLYMKWARRCSEQNLSHAACLDILVFGKSCRNVDKNRQVRKGWARYNLGACLDLYCDLRGWPRE